jgi:hypothetical protein
MLLKSRISATIGAALLVAALLMLVFVGCDKRKPMDTQELNEQQIAERASDILISLSPPQINLPTASTTDSSQVTIAIVDSEGVGLSGVRVNVTQNPQIGYLTSPDTTNEAGVTKVVFVAQPGVYGMTNIRASVNRKDDILDKTKSLYITGPSDYSLSIDHWPTVPKLIDRNGDPYTISATLVDTTGTGVPDQPVDFSILNGVGRLVDTSSTGTPVTNNEGIVSVLFYNTATDEQTDPAFALLQAVSTDPEDSLPLAALDTLMLLPVENTLSLETEEPTVFGDGSDSTMVRAILLDTYGHGIQGDTVRFRNQPFDGSLQGTAITDENGIAETAYHPFPGPDHLGVTRIIAEYKMNTIHEAVDTVDVDILPVRAIGFITVSLQQQDVTANGVDSTQIFITVQDSTGGLIADGTSIFLEHTGTGFLSPTQTTTTDGQALSVLRAPANIVGSPTKDSVFVWGHAGDSLIIADTAVVTYKPDTVDELLFIRPNSTVSLIAGSGAIDTIQVAAKDANGNPVANGTQINFVNELEGSSITPSQAPTQNGVATVIYLVGSETGDDNVRAFAINSAGDTVKTVQPVVYHCLSSDATTLQLSASQSSIEVGGASCQIIATLEDAYGNPLSEDYVVAFRIVTANGSQGTPDWPSFRTEPGVYNDTIPTNINGQAIVQIYSGRISGAVSIRACTISDTLFVCDEKSLITISSGPPYTISAHYNVIAEATNPESPERYVQVGAEVRDFYANPVEYGTAVYFTLIPNNVADIEGNSTTGTPRPYHPDSVEGWAFSRILFGCFASNDSLQVIALSAGDSVSVGDTSQRFPLPIYDPNISLGADPGNLWCGGFDCDSTDTSFITALLKDGGDCPVEGGEIRFVAVVAGTIIGPSIVFTDSTGLAETIYMIRGCEIPVQPSGIPTIETAVRAILFGYPDVEQEVTIICSRPQG